MQAKDFLTTEELRHFRTSNDAKAFSGFIFTWAIIFGCFAAVILLPSLLTYLVACIVLGGRQLALGILMHDCSHRSWFNTQGLNDNLGHWFAGVPLLIPLHYYRNYHFIHHVKTGTEKDPDVKNYKDFPVTKASMRRKILRDLAGITGIKSLTGVLVYVNMGRSGNSTSMGTMDYKDQSAKTILKQSINNFRDIIIFHGLFGLIATSIGHAELILLWWVAYIIPFTLFLRIRNIAEHGAIANLTDNLLDNLLDKDPRNTTRTTLANPIERMFFCPHEVNYHCEHHLIPNVPGYNLKELHQLLKKRGFYEKHPAALESSYIGVLKAATQ